MVDFRIQVTEAMKKRQTQTDKQKAGIKWSGLFGWRNFQTLEVQQYYILLNREAGLLNTDKKGGRVYGLYLDQGSRFSNCGRYNLSR